jgi:hypothetical protein
VCYVLKKEDTPIVTFTIPEVIRRTYIETYRSCAHKFFKQVIEGHEQPPTSYTQVGIDLHQQFENACTIINYPKERAIAHMKEAFENYSDDLFQSGFASDNREDMWTRTINSIDTFFDVVLPSLPVTPFTTEETIEFSVGDDLPNVQFTMDRIDDIDGELEMHDWKTGRVMVGQKLSSDLQAPLYIYGTIAHFGRKVRKFTFYYLNENKTRVFERSENPNIYICRVNKREYKINLMDSIREIQHVFSQIKKGNFTIPQNTSKMHFTCKMCHLREQGLCEGADMQSWNQIKKGDYSWT